MIAAYVTAMRRYASFNGRASRSGLWWFKLAMAILCLVALRIDGFIFGGTDHEMVPLFILVLLAHVVPSIAVDVRRLHDMDSSGWFALIGLVPLVGPVILVVWFCQPGTPGPNRFGPDPLAGAPALAIAASVANTGTFAQGGRPIAAAVHDVVAEIERLAKLRASGTLSESQYETLKMQIMAGAGRA